LSTSTRLAGATLLALGVALSIVSLRLSARDRAPAEATAATSAAASKDNEAADAEELRSIERRARQAATIPPLVAAVKMKVDDDTFIDLFDSEEWWRSYRNEFTFVRLIVDGTVVATRGTIDVGSLDKPVVKAARRQGVASSAVKIGNQQFLLAAAQLPVSPERPPILVLGREATAPAAPPVRVEPPAAAQSPLRFWPSALGGVMALAGLGLMLFRKRAQGEPPAAQPIPRTTPPMPELWTPLQQQRHDEASHPPVVSQTESGPMTSPEGIPAAVPVIGGTGPLSGPFSGPVGAPIAMLGRYRLLNRLGEGGMAELFTAEVTGVEGFSRTFVLKRLRPELATEKDAVAQFVEEARLQASLVHSNIVPVFDFGMAGSQYFMTQEYIIGRDLARFMERHQQRGGRGLPADVAFFIAHEVLQALAYAHDTRDNNGAPMGIVHRDVSASNVMLSFQGEVKLSDFGIVKSNRRISKTQVGMVKGNANFMAPEQARGNAVDGRSDLFSLGLLLYYCLTGDLLYWGDNDLEVLHRAATGPTSADIAGIMGMPEPAASILMRALALEPGDRFQSASEFAEALAPYVGSGKYAAGRLMQQLFATEMHRHRQSA
jgi:hypothetical protein